MKAKLIVAAIILSLACPSTSNAFALLKYVFDAVSNQLGLDRGPIPKALPITPPDAPGSSMARHPDSHRIYIQAEGF